MIHVQNSESYQGEGIYIGREEPGSEFEASPLGSPFKIDSESDRSQAIEQYRGWLDTQLKDPDSLQSRELNRLRQLYRKQGELTLICWCAPKACHGEVVREKILEGNV